MTDIPVKELRGLFRGVATIGGIIHTQNGFRGDELKAMAGRMDNYLRLLLQESQEKDLGVIAQWLYRRYATKADRETEWEMQGGKVKGPWLGDAQGILDALKAVE